MKKISLNSILLNESNALSKKEKKNLLGGALPPIGGGGDDVEICFTICPPFWCCWDKIIDCAAATNPTDICD